MARTCYERYPRRGYKCLWIDRTFELRLTWKTKDPDTLVVTPRDITGYIFEAQFRWTDASGTLIKTLTIGDGISVTDAANGEFNLKTLVDSTLFSQIGAKALMDIEVTLPGGDIIMFPNNDEPLQFYFETHLPAVQ